MEYYDSISRQEAIDAVDQYYKDKKYIARSRTILSAICQDIKNVIDSLPSAQSEQPPEIQDILNYLDTVLHPIISPEHWDVYSELHDMISTLPSAEPERKVFEEMSDTEFEKWLYEHGICNPDIHESISCDVVPSLIDFAINELPPTQPRWIPVTERLPDVSKSVLICDIEGDVYLGHRTRTGSYYPDFGDDRIKSVTAWMPRPKPYRVEEKHD